MEIFVRKIFRKSKEYILLFILLIISLVILTQSNHPEIKKIRRYAFTSFAVWANLLNSTISSENYELNKLKTDNAKLMLQVNKLHEYALENNELKSLLNFKVKANYKLIPATIIAKNISKSQGIFILNIGLKDSILKSMPVLNEAGLIGIVAEVTDNYSLVKTIASSSLKISANIPRCNVYGVISWSGENLVIHNVPTTADINKGDRVVTSVLSTIFPPSIPIGLVIERRSNISGLLSDILVQPFANVNSIKNVFVLSAVKSSQIDSIELNLLSQ